MKTLHVTVADTVATYQKRDGEIVCGNSVYQVKFAFDEEWDGQAEKTARFIWNGQFIDVDFTGDTCDVPKIRNADTVKVGVYAGNLMTTTSAEIPCRRSVLCEGATPSQENDKHFANEAKASADRAEAAADRAAEDATAAAAEEVAQLVGQIGIVQNTGDSETATMSQKATTEELNGRALRAEIDAIYGGNLFLYATVNGSISTSGGDRNSSAIDTSCRRTPYVPVYAGSVLTYAGFKIHNDYPCVAVYDADKTLVSSVKGIGTTDSTGRSGKLTIEVSGYIRLCSMRTSGASAILTRVIDDNAKADLTALGYELNRVQRTHTNSAFANMMAVAETYFTEAYQNKNLVYASQRSAMLANQKDDNGMNATNCSGFINTILKGITYANSRYCRGHNKFADWAWISDRSGRYEYSYEDHGEIYDYLTSYNLARYCAEHGWLKKVNYTSYDASGNFVIASADRTKPDYLANVHVGDIVFTGRGITEELNGGTYLGINDAALVVAVGHYTNSDGTTSHTIHVMSAYDHTDTDGNRVGVDINRYTHETAEFTYAATIPVQEALFASNVIFASRDMEVLDASNEVIYNNSKQFEPGLYTFSVHGDSNNDSLSTFAPYLSVSYDGQTNIVVTSCKTNGWSDIVFYAEKPFDWMVKCKKGTAEKYGVFDELIIYKGAKPCLLTR